MHDILASCSALNRLVLGYLAAGAQAAHGDQRLLALSLRLNTHGKVPAADNLAHLALGLRTAKDGNEAAKRLLQLNVMLSAYRAATATTYQPTVATTRRV